MIHARDSDGESEKTSHKPRKGLDVVWLVESEDTEPHTASGGKS